MKRSASPLIGSPPSFTRRGFRGQSPRVNDPLQIIASAAVTSRSTDNNDDNNPIFDRNVLDVNRNNGCVASCGGATVPRWKAEEDIDSIIVQDLNSLSLQERESLYEDIHGVEDHFKETETFLEQKLEGMQTAINWNKNKKAYDRARFLDPSFVYDRKLRLAMIRSSNYDEIDAAKRLILHFNSKLELFGIDKLVKPITQDDLTPNMHKWLRSGHFQIMPKDRAGRTIIFAKRNSMDDQDVNGFYGMIWYLIMSSFVQDETRKFVCILWHIGSGRYSEFRERGKSLRKFDACFPTRMAAYHYTYNDARLRPLMTLVQLSTLSNNRLRFRSHFGTDLECAYELMSYGITLDMLPIDENGVLDLAGLNRRLDTMRDRERAATVTTKLIPKSRDCLLGRGYPFQTFEGNIFVSCVVQQNRERYSQLARNDKSTMVDGLVTFVRAVRGGRFLKREDVDEKSSRWVLASDSEVRTKVMQVFRTVVRNDLPDLGPFVSYALPGGLSLRVPQSSVLEGYY